jgi:DNA-binding transcriptional LysR family regulator
MRNLPATLLAFVEVANSGSFSAAARKLGKRQSSVSEAINNLEAELGLTLFDRGSWKPVLTAAGHAMLAHAKRMVSVSEEMSRQAAQMAGGLETRLSVVISDMSPPDRFTQALTELQRRFPDLEFEYLIAEHGDAVELIRQNRAHLGLVAAMPAYPDDIGATVIAEQAELVLYVGKHHILARYGDTEVPHSALSEIRELRLHAFDDPHGRSNGGACVHGARYWSAPDYVALMKMAVSGFGWAELPRWLVSQCVADQLHEVRTRGWPRHVPIDILWSLNHPLGKAGAWLLAAMQAD